MAFKNLKELTQEEYQALTLTPIGPVNRDKIGDPDPAAEIKLGGWASADVLAFMVLNAQYSDSGLSIEAAALDTLGIMVTDGVNPGMEISYWTVNVGEDNEPSQWTITYDVKKKTKSTGKWVFTKGKGDDDVDPK